MRYTAYISLLQYGSAEVEAANEAEAKEKAHACYERGDVMWHDEEVTDITVKPEVENARTYTVTEVCPHCENEIEMTWDTDARGYLAYCPVCGGRLMLCDECLHTEGCGGKCDYDSKTDSCYRNPPKGGDEE